MHIWTSCHSTSPIRFAHHFMDTRASPFSLDGAAALQGLVSCAFAITMPLAHSACAIYRPSDPLFVVCPSFLAMDGSFFWVTCSLRTLTRPSPLFCSLSLRPCVGFYANRGLVVVTSAGVNLRLISCSLSVPFGRVWFLWCVYPFVRQL